MTIRTILLIDDHALFRSGLKMVLKTGLANIEVVEAGSMEDAMLLPTASLSVLLLDIELRGLNGLDGLALLKRKWPATPVIVLSADQSADTMRLAHERGAARFVAKSDSADHILAIIADVLQGIHCGDEDNLTGSDAKGSILLTPRQYEVLDLICQGLSNKAIGKRLHLSENTVRGHVQAILAALGVESRSEAAFAAHRRGLVH